MIDIGAISILTLFLILGHLEAVTVVNHHSDDEYVLEHEVLREDALAEAKKLEIHPGPIPGCKPCTSTEMTYCKDGSVINDHCCCDGSFNIRSVPIRRAHLSHRTRGMQSAGWRLRGIHEIARMLLPFVLGLRLEI
ncbi:uncharacterized protein [Polyergus mexicanus]|uniref:uncharacterized protein isoform X3 n=1 Tax=Polyergus mexicanus TaxID=615972 RepID=UPI0038B47D8B